jgi:outer membrane murein-binding lipoprotein Lpp
MCKDKMNNFFKILGYLLSGILLTFSSQVCLADISIDSYCQVVVQSMQQEVSNMQELIAIINQYKDDHDTLAQQIEALQAQFDQARNDLYFSFGTTADEYVFYMGKNAKEINSYLEANPDIKQQIDNLSTQLYELTEQEQALMGGDKPLPPPPPAQ